MFIGLKCDRFEINLRVLKPMQSYDIWHIVHAL